jgi:hypothetical protein
VSLKIENSSLPFRFFKYAVVVAISFHVLPAKSEIPVQQLDSFNYNVERRVIAYLEQQRIAETARTAGRLEQAQSAEAMAWFNLELFKNLFRKLPLENRAEYYAYFRAHIRIAEKLLKSGLSSSPNRLTADYLRKKTDLFRAAVETSFVEAEEGVNASSTTGLIKSELPSIELTETEVTDLVRSCPRSIPRTGGLLDVGALVLVGVTFLDNPKQTYQDIKGAWNAPRDPSCGSKDLSQPFDQSPMAVIAQKILTTQSISEFKASCFNTIWKRPMSVALGRIADRLDFDWKVRAKIIRANFIADFIADLPRWNEPAVQKKWADQLKLLNQTIFIVGGDPKRFDGKNYSDFTLANLDQNISAQSVPPSENPNLISQLYSQSGQGWATQH